ncbi:MAG: diguanylate cyclase [Candidatus Saccharibacteria bacterium]|nr:diguanylate cyclase [Candidatus Saccharibacteria bacterium]
MKLKRFRLSNLPWRTIGISAVVAAIYFITAKTGLALAIAVEQVSPIWPPTGIALAVVLLLGYRYLPAIAIGAFLANATSNEPLLIAAIIAVGNTLEAFVGAYIIKRFTHLPRTLVADRNLFVFIVAAAVCCVVSATIGTSSLFLGGLAEGQSYWLVWITWWAGDALGAIICSRPLSPWRLSCWRAWSSSLRHAPCPSLRPPTCFSRS